MTLHRAQRSSRRRSTHRGFTLIELMITVAIVAILARVALPAYLDYAKRGKLTEAFNQLSAESLALAQYYQDNRTYVGFPAASCGVTTANFSYDCSTLSATGYTMKANGAGSLTNFQFTLDEKGSRLTPNAPAGWPKSASAPGCWISSRSGTCQ